MGIDKHSKDVCSHRHAFFLDNFLRKIFQNPKKIVGTYINEGDTVVDLGCGPGYFSIEMAKMAGNSGHVYAVDLQKEMLEITRKKAERQHLEERMTFYHCAADSIGMPDSLKADLVLAFYMVHETPDHIKFFKEIKTFLKHQGKCLIVEPNFHVTKKQFNKMKTDILDIGFTILDSPPKKGGRSLLITH